MPRCMICDSQTTEFARVPVVGLDEPFLDDELRRQLPELNLTRCAACGCLWCNDARQDEQLLLSAYARTPPAYFGSLDDDPRYMNFYGWLEQLLTRQGAGRRIFDVGCGDGSFLAALDDGWEKHGLDPSHSGVASAEAKGVQARVGAITECDSAPADVVSALDVIEHSADPRAFVAAMARHCAAGALALIVTGDADSWPARAAGTQWSYLRWAGHVSILSRRALVKLLRDHGFNIVAWRRCSHPASSSPLAWWRVHLLEPARSLLGRPCSWYPFWSDHQVVIARRAP